MSWKPEVETRPGEWTGNALRFATKEEAEGYALDLAMRWTAVKDTRVVECSDAVNYRWTGKLESVSV